jgi:hypothetical protein
LQEFTDQSGTYEGRRIPAQLRPTIGFTSSEKLTYEDFPWWLQFMIGVNAGLAAVGDAGTPEAFTREAVPSLETDDLASMTLEFNHVGNPYESSQVMVNTWTIRIDPDNEGAWMLDTEMVGRTWDTTAFTGSLPDRTVSIIKAPGTKMFIDDTFGGLGTTQLTGKLIGASVTGNNNLHLKAFSEDEVNFAAGKVGRGLRTFDAQFVWEFDDDVEFAKYRTTGDPVERFVRIEREGATIHGAVKKRARIDMNGFYMSWAPGDREGNLTMTMGLACYYNATAGYSLAIEVVNTQDDPLV